MLCLVFDRLIGATQILEQISENEQERLFELERKDQENIQMQKYLEKLMEEDRNKLEKKAVEQTLLRVRQLLIYPNYIINIILLYSGWGNFSFPKLYYQYNITLLRGGNF